jgi:hypothetical protein
VNISCPVAGSNANVVLIGSGPAGCMCARGTITGFGQARRANSGITVKLMVYNTVLNPANIPPTPDPKATSVTPFGQDWICVNLPVPGCGSGGSAPQYTIVGWEIDSGTVTFIDAKLFFAVCASAVDCGGGTGSGSGPAPEMVRRHGPSAVVALAPAVWSLMVSGFLASLGVGFNGSWLLRLRDATRAGASGGWDNGGDAVTIPKIELCCDSPPGDRWRLRLRHGLLAHEYTAPVGWEALGPLVLTADVPQTLPSTLTLNPV